MGGVLGRAILCCKRADIDVLDITMLTNAVAEKDWESFARIIAEHWAQYDKYGGESRQILDAAVASAGSNFQT